METGLPSLVGTVISNATVPSPYALVALSVIVGADGLPIAHLSSVAVENNPVPAADLAATMNE